MNQAAILQASNNHAATLIQAGQYRQAYKGLQEDMSLASDAIAACSKCYDEHSHETRKYGSSLNAPLSIMALTQTNNACSVDSNGIFPWPLTSRIMENTSSISSNHSVSHENADELFPTCAISFFNMGLACHLLARQEQQQQQQYEQQSQTESPFRTQALLRLRAANLYMRAFEIGLAFHLPTLNLAVCTNLMEISYEQGDLPVLHAWSDYYVCKLPELTSGASLEMLPVVKQTLWYYTGDLVAAKAA